MTMTTCKRRVQTNGDLVVETRIPKWDPVREGELIRTLGGCDNTSRPGFRIDPPFAWETAHEAYFGAVASAQDLLMRTDSPIMRTQRPFFWPLFFEKKTAQI